MKLLRHAVRSLARTPIISLLVVLCSGLGAGAATTVFAWTEHLVRKPLPAVEAPQRLVSVVGMRRGREESVSYPDGVLAFRVSQRKTELAVRLALGATQLDVLRLVVGDGLRQAFCGIGVGALLGILATRLISARLPRVSLDPGVLLASAIALTATALLASLLPALHATSVDPTGALKSE